MSVVGVDLGTTNTVVGCVRSGKVHVLADEKGQRLLPSVVSFHPSGDVLVGGAAKARRVIDAANTVYSHKRLIGRSWGSPEIAQARQRFAFELREGPGQGPLVHARGQDYTLPEISAFVLKRARQIAEQALGTPVERAVITVPAHFNELQRASTKVAGRVSGLEVLRILNEPTAAALAYGLGRTGNERVAVYDFGGGTFDCTLLDLNGNVFEVLATAGDSFLGGDDVDNLIADRMAEVFLKQYRQDATQDVQMYERLKATAEDVKIALSTAETHTIVLKEFGHGAGGATLDFQFTLTRKDLDAMLAPVVDRTFKVTQDALALARLTPTSFDKVILVGGSTRMPLVRKRVEAFFGGPPMDRVNPDEVVAIGAAIQAAALTEGIRRRSIPAPPTAPQPRPSQRDTQDNTLNDLDSPSAKPAFASEPPAFGFGAPAPSPGSAPRITGTSSPDLQTQVRPPPSAPHTRPLSDPGVPGAKAPLGPMRPRQPTMAGVAPEAPFEWSPPGAPDKDDAGLPLVRTMPLHSQARAPGGRTPPTIAKKAVPAAPQTAPMLARGPQGPLGSTVPLGQTHPLARTQPQPTPKRPLTTTEPSGSSPTAQAFAPPPSAPTLPATGPLGPPPLPPVPSARTLPLEAPPQQNAYPSAPPPPQNAYPSAPPPQNAYPSAQAQQNAYPSAPPQQNAYPSAPPQQNAYPSAPPQPNAYVPTTQASPKSAYASAAPPMLPHFSGSPSTASQPPPQHQAFSFGSAPPRALEASMAPPFSLPSAPPPTQAVQYNSPVLVDVTPRGLVVETAGGYTDTIIPRNSKIPCERTRRFATSRDMQTTVRVRVAQGEDQAFPQNTFLGEVELTGLRPAPRGTVTVAVTFEVDADGSLRVRARDVQTGHEARATLQLVGVADESSVVMMMHRLAQQPVGSGSSKS